MKLLISSTVRTFTSGTCSYGTLHLKGLYVPLDAEIDVLKAHCAVESAVTEVSSANSWPTETDANSFVVRCIDTKSVPNELHAFVQFDLPPGCIYLKQSMAAQLTALILRILDDLEDLHQDGCNEGLNIVSSNINDFLKDDFIHDARSHINNGQNAPKFNNISSVTTDSTVNKTPSAQEINRETGVLVYTCSTLPKESRFVRARQQEASLRFQLNSLNDHPSSELAAGGALRLQSGTSPGAQNLSMHAFSVTHRGTLCTISISRAGVGNVIRAGDHLSVQLDFGQAHQTCMAVKVQLTSKQLRQGGAGMHLVTQVVNSRVKSTKDAVIINFSVAIPEWSSAGMKALSLETTATAGIPVFGTSREGTSDPLSIKYWLEFHFYLDEKNMQELQTPFVWNIPLNVHCIVAGDGEVDTDAVAGEELCDISPFYEPRTSQMYATDHVRDRN
jgi:hypothetical protein